VTGAIEAIKYANDVFVVSNQGGIARGLYSEEDVRTLHGIWRICRMPS
jgi:D-glycero-D-manno-heptose 1,7-bisphosphate phosphatase